MPSLQELPVPAAASGFSPSQIYALAKRWMPATWQPEQMRLLTDTTDFFEITYGDVLLLGGTPFLVRNSAREGRFGLEDEVKHWVKRAIELPTGRMCIIKMVFHERFFTHIGGVEFECFRSPRKEARILRLVAGHPNFMQGCCFDDHSGNPVRVLEYISGSNLPDHIENIAADHETYFHHFLPAILDNFIECVRSIRFLHEHGEKHGDIRRDHILIDAATQKYRWIDFDYNYRHRESLYSYDLFGLGNILIFIVGKGDLVLPELQRKRPELLSGLSEGDFNVVFHNRLANLQKVFSYLPDSLNRVLLHFSLGANWHYEHTSQLIQDLEEARAEL